MIGKPLVLLAAAIVLAACSGPLEAKGSATEQTPATSEPDRVVTPSAAADALRGGLARSDAQGAVEFVVEPLDLEGSGGNLEFAVSMTTHSVDLGWDLAATSTLQTDTGLEVGAVGWPVGSGNHVGGTLSFPRLAVDGQDLLEGGSILRLVIRDTDVPERVFTWKLDP